MNRDLKNGVLLVSVLAIIGAVAVTAWRVAYAPQNNNQAPVTQVTDGADNVPRTTAEFAALDFITAVFASAPPETAGAAEQAVMMLSPELQATINPAAPSGDLARLVGVQDVPNDVRTVSVLPVTDTQTEVTIELTYSGGVVERVITVEQVSVDEWQIVAVAVSEPEPTPVPPSEPVVDAGGACFVGGCSSQVCSDDPEVMTTCEWREEYACYQNATCERQANGQCGWTETESLLQCLTDAATAELDMN